MKLKKTLLSTIFGLSLLAPLFDAYAMEPDEDELQHIPPSYLKGWVRKWVKEPEIENLDISQCTYIELRGSPLMYVNRPRAFVPNIRAKKIKTALAHIEYTLCGYYSYIGPVEDAPHVIVHDGILCDKLGLENKPITNEYLQGLIDKKDLVVESKLDRSRCVGFAVSANSQDEVSVYPIHIAPSLLPKNPQRLQPGTTPSSWTVSKHLDFCSFPEIKIIFFSEADSRVFPSSFCSRHFFSDIESNYTSHQIILILFQSPQKKLLENIDDQREFVEIDKQGKLKIIENASLSNNVNLAATAPADEMAKTEKTKAAQAAARKRKEAIERAEKIAAAAQEHYNMDDLDNSLSKEETDTTD